MIRRTWVNDPDHAEIPNDPTKSGIFVDHEISYTNTRNEIKNAFSDSLLFCVSAHILKEINGSPNDPLDYVTTIDI